MRPHRRTNPPSSSSADDNSGCSHPALFNSMCVACGKTIKGTVAPVMVSSNSSSNSQSQQSIGVAAHGPAGATRPDRMSLMTIKRGGGLLQISREDAKQVQQSKVNALRRHKKLALVLDLDHTLLHAVQMDGPAPSQPLTLPQSIDYRQYLTRKILPAHLEFGEKDCATMIHHLPIEEIVAGQVRHLVMKKRSHLDIFLREVQSFCQLTIYTAGTRRYAEAVAKVIDPSRRYFAERIISRSDVPNVRNDGNDKSLERLFLGDSSMAVIIDDREDVWMTGNQFKQLLLVRPFVHFDPTAASSLNSNKSMVNASSDNSVMPPASTTSLQPSEANEGMGHSPIISLRPMKVNAIDEKDKSAEGISSGTLPAGRVVGTSGAYSEERSSKDDQLLRCLDILRAIHLQYYSASADNVVLDDCGPQQTVADILQEMKKQILAGCTITFSGVIPTNERIPQQHFWWRLAESMGAQVSTDLVARTTHLICLHTQTKKAVECLKHRQNDVWIVHPDWLFHCRWSLSRCLESTFMLNALAPGQSFPQSVMNFQPLSAPVSTPDQLIENAASGSSNEQVAVVMNNSSEIVRAVVTTSAAKEKIDKLDGEDDSSTRGNGSAVSKRKIKDVDQNDESWPPMKMLRTHDDKERAEVCVAETGDVVSVNGKSSVSVSYDTVQDDSFRSYTAPSTGNVDGYQSDSDNSVEYDFTIEEGQSVTRANDNDEEDEINAESEAEYEQQGEMVTMKSYGTDNTDGHASSGPGNYGVDRALCSSEVDEDDYSDFESMLCTAKPVSEAEQSANGVACESRQSADVNLTQTANEIRHSSSWENSNTRSRTYSDLEFDRSDYISRNVS